MGYHVKFWYIDLIDLIDQNLLNSISFLNLTV